MPSKPYNRLADAQRKLNAKVKTDAEAAETRAKGLTSGRDPYPDPRK